MTESFMLNSEQINMFDRVELKDGRKGSVLEIFPDSVLIDIEIENNEWSDEFVEYSEILRKIPFGISLEERMAYTISFDGIYLNTFAHKNNKLTQAVIEGNKDLVKKLLDSGHPFDTEEVQENTALAFAVLLNKVIIAKMLFDKGANIFHNCRNGETPLMYTAQHGRIDILSYFLDNGVDIETKCSSDTTLLMNAAREGQWKTVEMLLKRGANVNQVDINKTTALVDACLGGYRPKYIKTIQLLLDAGADINKGVGESGTPLMWAVIYGYDTKKQIKLLQMLLNNGAHINVRDRKGETALCKAVVWGNLKIFRFLLGKGANPFLSDATGFTPLMKAIEHKQIPIIQLLLESETDIEEKNVFGLTALAVAVFVGEKEIVSLLLQKKANLECSVGNNTTNRSKPNTSIPFSGLRHDFYSLSGILSYCEGDTPLLLAVRICNVAMVKFLLTCGANASATNCNNENALMVLVKSKSYERQAKREITDLLSEHIQNVDERNEDGKTTLMLAIENSFNDIENLIKALNYDINAKDNAGNTPLMIASYFEKPQIVELLLKNGANANEKNNMGRTALMETFTRNSFTGERTLFICKLLLPYILDINVKDAEGKTALMWATESCVESTAKLLLENGADIHAQDNEGKTAFMKAVYWENIEMLRTLLDFNADKNMQDNNGNTAITLAKKYGRRKVIALLNSYDTGSYEKIECGSLSLENEENRKELQKSQNDALLHETYITGTAYIDNFIEPVSSLRIKDELLLIREPENRYDKRAILVKTSDNKKI